MNNLQRILALVVLAFLMGKHSPGVAAVPLVDLGLGVGDIIVNCGAPAGERTYSFVANWNDPTAAGSFYVKNGSQCKVIADSLGALAKPQPCGTNAYQSCTPRCKDGKCHAEFADCVLGRGAYLYVVANDGSGYSGTKFAVPACN